MRILLKITSLLLVFSAKLSAQNDFKSLDEKTFDYYIRGDYKNLEKTTDTLLSLGIDYYYMRMRLGILAYNNQRYPEALNHFTRALEFSSLDTISREYIYYSYLLSGRKADANLYLESIPPGNKNSTLKSIGRPGFSDLYVGSSASVYDANLHNINNLYYEALNSSLSINAGFESYLLRRFKGTFAFTNYRKKGKVYSASIPSGTNLDFSQYQVYARLTGYVFHGWEFSGFGHVAFYKEFFTPGQKNTEYLGGIGLSKNGWKIRTGANLSFSNFSYSNQIRVEGYLTWLPFGNLNLYITSGGLYQNDKYWGGTYQINQEIGFKIFKLLWMETGIVKGNSFLYARNQGYMMNNSFQIPATTIYSNIIILPGKQFSITLTPFFTEYQDYSWDLNLFTRTGKLTHNSFGGAIKLTYKNK